MEQQNKQFTRDEKLRYYAHISQCLIDAIGSTNSQDFARFLEGQLKRVAGRIKKIENNQDWKETISEQIKKYK